jgi:hypothetical protein
MKHCFKKSFILLSLPTSAIILFILFAKLNTRPHKIATEDFVSGRDLELAFIGDSIATDMVRAYDFLKDAVRLATPSTGDAITGHVSKENPFGLIDWISVSRPVAITNYSRPGADLITRRFFNEPSKWQRWAVNIPDLQTQVDRFLSSKTHPNHVAIWTGHVDLLYWNSFQGALLSMHNDDERRQWIVDKFVSEYEVQVMRLIDWAKNEPNPKLIIFGLLDWKEVTRIAEEIQKLKNDGVKQFALAERRLDPEGQIQLWQNLNQGLRQMALHHSIIYSPVMEKIELKSGDFEIDGIHPSRSGKQKIASLLSTAFR